MFNAIRNIKGTVLIPRIFLVSSSFLCYENFKLIYSLDDPAEIIYKKVTQAVTDLNTANEHDKTRLRFLNNKREKIDAYDVGNSDTLEQLQKLSLPCYISPWLMTGFPKLVTTLIEASKHSLDPRIRVQSLELINVMTSDSDNARKRVLSEGSNALITDCALRLKVFSEYLEPAIQTLLYGTDIENPDPETQGVISASPKYDNTQKLINNGYDVAGEALSSLRLLSNLTRINREETNDGFWKHQQLISSLLNILKAIYPEINHYLKSRQSMWTALQSEDDLDDITTDVTLLFKRFYSEVKPVIDGSGIMFPIHVTAGIPVDDVIERYVVEVLRNLSIIHPEVVACEDVIAWLTVLSNSPRGGKVSDDASDAVKNIVLYLMERGKGKGNRVRRNDFVSSPDREKKGFFAPKESEDYNEKETNHCVNLALRLTFVGVESGDYRRIPNENEGTEDKLQVRVINAIDTLMLAGCYGMLRTAVGLRARGEQFAGGELTKPLSVRFSRLLRGGFKAAFGSTILVLHFYDNYFDKLFFGPDWHPRELKYVRKSKDSLDRASQALKASVDVIFNYYLLTIILPIFPYAVLPAVVNIMRSDFNSPFFDALFLYWGVDNEAELVILDVEMGDQGDRP